MKVAAADALRIALPLLAARALAPLVARWVPLPRALQFAVVKGPALDVEVAAHRVVVEGAGATGGRHVEAGQVAAVRAAKS